MVGTHVDPGVPGLAGGSYRTVTFRIPLAHRSKQLVFKVGATLAEEDGCVKVKHAEDEYGNQFLMKLILRQELDMLPDSAEVRGRLNTEIGVLKILDHRHIIKLFQVFSSDDIVYALMEQVTTPLANKIKDAGGKLPEAPARRYFQQLLDAVSYLHGRGLVHRDLSLDHMVLDDMSDMLKVTSFGFSCLQSSRELLKDHPRVDPVYAAPEILGTEPYHGKKSDIWSLGCVLHQMLTGVPPYKDGSCTSDPAGLEMSGATPKARALIEKTLEHDFKVRINLNELLKEPWVSEGGDPEIPLAAESFCFPGGILGSSGLGMSAEAAQELEASTTKELQASFAKLEGLQLGSMATSLVTPPREATLTSPDSQDVVDDTFSPLRKERRRPFALLDTPLGAHKEIEPLWASGAEAAGGGEGDLHFGPPPTLELSPRASVSSPSARTRKMLRVDILSTSEPQCDSQFEASPMHKRAGGGFEAAAAADAGIPAPAVDAVRKELAALTAPGVVTDHDMAVAVGQRLTAARYAHYKAHGQIYPAVYPPPPAGDGSDVFRAADEGGEGLCTRKEIAKFLMRNQTLRHRLREGWAKFNSNFGTEDTPENHQELNQAQFCELWLEAAKMRKD